MLDIKNKKFWNIFKGLSILFIVIGHSCLYLVPFVYLFHLALFFFLGGYFYKEDEYAKDPYLFFTKKLKKNWLKFFTYSLFFIILHNFFVSLGFIISKNYFISDIVTSIVNTSMFFGTESLSGALWFVPVYIFASLLFGYIIYASEKVVILKKKKELNKNLIIILLSLICGIFGYYFVYRNIYVMLHVHTSFLVLPILTLGYYVKKYNKIIEKYLNIVLFIITFVILGFLSFKTSYRVNLTDNAIGNIFMFYFVSAIGIYFTLYLSKIIYRIKYVDSYYELLGKYSFEIMAFHFLIFKIIDFMYSLKGIMNNTISVELYGKFPYAYVQLWPLYIILGATIPALVFLFKDKVINNEYKVSEKVKRFLSNKKVIVSMSVLLIILIIIPLIKLGIMHNDELMSRLWSSKGFTTFYLHYFREQIEKGRALSSVIIPFTQYLGFIGQDTYQFKVPQILSIFACLFFMCKLLNRIFKDKKMVMLYALLFISFLQISFEPTVPNVFVTFYNVSICGLLYSLTLYVDYLNTLDKKKLILSMILFGIVEITYESFVTYVPLYLLLYLNKVGIKNIFKDIKAFLSPILVGISYIIIYVVFTKLFPSNYAGNQIGSINLLKSLKIITILGYYSLPGSYLTSSKYKYLFRFHLRASKFDILRICALLIPFIFLFLSFVTKDKKEKVYNCKLIQVIKVIFISGVAVILPILPISIASMYQQMNIGVVTIGLPVSFFSYFAGVLLLTIVIKYICNNFKLGRYISLLVVIVMFIGVQSMNNTFSREANNDFKRIQYIESFINSDFIDQLDTKEIHSNDLFLTKHSLFVHDSHWNEYMNSKNIECKIIHDLGDSNENNIYLNDAFNTFIYSKNNKYYIFTLYDVDSKLDKYISKTDDYKLNKNWKNYSLTKEGFDYLMENQG